MFDVGWQELFLIAIVALIVIGPKDLPKALRTGAKLLNKARAMSREFQAGLAEIAREAELDELKRTVEKAARFDPAEEMKRAVDPTGKFTEDFDPTEFNRKLKAAVEGGPPTGPASPQPPAQERSADAVTPSPPLSQAEAQGASSDASPPLMPSPVVHPDAVPAANRPSGMPESETSSRAVSGTETHR